MKDKPRLAMYPFNPAQDRHRLERDEAARQGYTFYGIRNEGLLPVLSESIDVLFLEWLSPYCIDEKPAKSLLKSCLFLFQLLVLRLRGTVIWWNLQNIFDHEGRCPKIDLWLRRWVFRLADHVRVYSESARQQVIARYQPSQDGKLIVRPLPSLNAYFDSIKQANPPAPANIGKSSGAADGICNILFLGHIRPYKGIMELVEQLPWEQVPSHVRFTIAGKPRGAVSPVTGAFPEQISWVLRYIADEELPQFFAEASAVIFPYKSITTTGAFLLCAGFHKAPILPRLPFFEEFLGPTYPYYYQDARDLLRVCHELDPVRCAEIGARIRDKVAQYDAADQLADMLAVACGRSRSLGTQSAVSTATNRHC